MLGWSEGLLMRTEGQAVTAGDWLQSSYNFNEIHRPPALTGQLHNDNHDTEMAFKMVGCQATHFQLGPAAV